MTNTLADNNASRNSSSKVARLPGRASVKYLEHSEMAMGQRSPDIAFGISHRLSSGFRPKAQQGLGLRVQGLGFSPRHKKT